MPSSHLILCHPLLLLPPIPPSITVFSNDSTLHMRWPKYWSFSFSIIPSKEIPGLTSFHIILYIIFVFSFNISSKYFPTLLCNLSKYYFNEVMKILWKECFLPNLYTEAITPILTVFGNSKEVLNVKWGCKWWFWLYQPNVFMRSGTREFVSLSLFFLKVQSFLFFLQLIS